MELHTGYKVLSPLDLDHQPATIPKYNTCALPMSWSGDDTKSVGSRPDAEGFGSRSDFAGRIVFPGEDG